MTVTVRLSQHDIEYLNKASFLNSNQLKVLQEMKHINDVSATLTLSRDLAEEFREAFTNQLAEVGFDENYEATSEGNILEDLIDKFYM